jgi:hypothetical protein
MALIKNKILKNLQEVNYWRLVRINHLSKDGTEVFLGGFVSKQVSDKIGDAGILDIVIFNFESDKLGKQHFINSNPYETAYNNIKESNLDKNGKELNFFADALDF